jgi:hypothetical protein
MDFTMFGFDVRDKGRGELEAWRRWLAREARAGDEVRGGTADGREGEETAGWRATEAVGREELGRGGSEQRGSGWQPGGWRAEEDE